MTTDEGVFARSTVGNDELAQVRTLVAASAAVDGVPALNEATELRLSHQVDDSRHLVARSGTRVVGYAHLDLGSGVVEGVVHPDHRRSGVGAALAAELGPEATSAWAHGDHPGAAGLARSLGWSRTRELLQMRLDLASARLPEPSFAPGVAVRTFVPGTDEAAWLGANAAAFADHPEQGSLTRSDLDQRIHSEWFDPAGFFLAEREGTLLGFHWTKLHPDGSGEVYVLGVTPAAQGLGLGKSLALVGLHHLRASGVPTCLLYVEADNAAAVGLYERLGFTVSATDVMYSRPTG